jgi:hypothetical protein
MTADQWSRPIVGRQAASNIRAQLHVVSLLFHRCWSRRHHIQLVTDAFLGSATCRRKCPSKQLLKQLSLTKAYTNVYLGEPQSRGRRLRVDSTWSRHHSLLKNSRLESWRFSLSPLIPFRETCVVPPLYHDLCV